MKNSIPTYGQLYDKLKALGYKPHPVEIDGKKAQAFEHERVPGAMILLPDRPAECQVEPLYLQSVQVILKSRGLLPETNHLLT